jgi:hypothetical protein
MQMSALIKDDKIEYWVEHIHKLVYDADDTSSEQEKSDNALELETQISERINSENLDEEYLTDVIKRIDEDIEILKNRAELPENKV